MNAKKRLLIFIVAYNAERTIQKVLQRIPATLAKYDCEILIIDDSSSDRTFEKASAFESEFGCRFPITTLFNPVNQGYGGNQKIGFQYAIRNGFEMVALVHGDGQYAPECLPDLVQPLAAGEADAVFGSRMISPGAALRGGMPLYKFVGNRILSTIQNRLLRSSLSEFHSGYRLYSVAALSRIPFDLNTNDFHFDTEIIIQLLRAGMQIRELPIPTYYGDEICHVNGIRYAWDVIRATLRARAQDAGIFYDRKFDVSGESPYRSKLAFDSSHTMALASISPGTTVVDVGCASGYMAAALKRKGCRVIGIDQPGSGHSPGVDRFLASDLDRHGFPKSLGGYHYVLLLDVIEHLRSPESFLESLRRNPPNGPPPTVIVTTGNIAFIVTRLMLLLGWFNYGKRGILDLTHTRLFTFMALQRLFEQAGYTIEEVKGVPAPFPLALGDHALSRLLIRINRWLIRLSRGLFSYQVLLVARPLPSLEWLLDRTLQTSAARAASAR
jgi:glycosyltransferase involved in cell wall biosynthesis